MLLGLTLMGCQGSTTSTKKIEWGGIVDSRLRQQCSGVVRLPKSALTQAQIERYWKVDRLALIKCGKLHKETIDAIDSAFKKV